MLWVAGDRAPIAPAHGSSPRRRAATVIVALMGVCVGVGIARAQQQGAPAGPSLRQACFSDARSFCSETQPGGGRVLACLKQNAASLSPGCQQALLAARDKAAQSGR
jgi:hypothetical protein